MPWKFDSEKGLVLISVDLFGPSGSSKTIMAFDTGATHTFIRIEVLEEIGYCPENCLNKVTVATGGGEVYAPVIEIENIEALGQSHRKFSVTAVSLPSSVSIDGVVGLDFLRGHLLTLDFQKGLIHFE